MPRPTCAGLSILLGAMLIVSPGVGAATAHTRQLSPVVYAWFFGYIGDTFYPQSRLGLSPSDLFGAASGISSAVGGKNNLALVSAVDEVQGRIVEQSMYPAVARYVSSLHQYAAKVYGRLDLFQFNETSSPSIYSEVGKYVANLKLDGVFLDHAAAYYAAVGQTSFNGMMQQLSNEYPGASFILNQADPKTLIIPLGGDTWASTSLVSPSVNLNSYDQVSLQLIHQLGAYWPGRILLHLDSYAANPAEPMGIFADQTSSTEVKAASYLHATGNSNNFYFLFPVVGAWTCGCSAYKGNLYNSLGKGSYARNTLPAFTQIMQS